MHLLHIESPHSTAADTLLPAQLQYQKWAKLGGGGGGGLMECSEIRQESLIPTLVMHFFHCKTDKPPLLLHICEQISLLPLCVRRGWGEGGREKEEGKPTCQNFPIIFICYLSTPTLFSCCIYCTKLPGSKRLSHIVELKSTFEWTSTRFSSYSTYISFCTVSNYSITHTSVKPFGPYPNSRFQFEKSLQHLSSPSLPLLLFNFKG